MQIEPASNAVGAIVSDVDVRTMGDDDFTKLHQAFADHGALFIRDQHLAPEDHIAFAERWGEININRFFAAVPDHPQIAQVLKEPDQTVNIGGGWHTDHSYDAVPAMGSILYALETPPSGGDTLFAGMAAAYDALDDEMKERLEGLEAFHSNAHIFGEESDYAKEMGDRFGNAKKAVQEAVHPVVLPHPVTGRKGLYVNPAFTIRILGIDEQESADLLMQLYAHIMQEEFHFRFQWEPGSLAMWDNRSTWHYAMNDYHGHRRLMHRITVEGVPLH
ncbi:MAG: TauD/TfdA family dioxygenase [Pseudomonadota bacterium]